MENRWGKNGNSDIIFLGSKITVDGKCSHEIKRHLLLGRKTMTNLDSILKSRDIILPTKVHLVKAMVFPVVMYRCESWTIKKAEHHRIDALEQWCWRRLESPLDSKEIKPVNPKGNQFWIFLGRTNAEAEAPILWQPDAKSQLIGKVPDAWKDWGQKEKGEKDDEMVGWHHWLNRHEVEQTPGDSEGQGSLLWCSPWDHKESDITKWLKNKEQQNLRKSTSFVNVTAITTTTTTTKTGKKLSETFFFFKIMRINQRLATIRGVFN